MPPPPQPSGGKVTPNLAMDAEATGLLNLTVLQRLDPAVEDSLITAVHATLYDFNIDLNQWSRKDVEGSLFVVKRFQFIVMNRQNTGDERGRWTWRIGLAFFGCGQFECNLLPRGHGYSQKHASGLSVSPMELRWIPGKVTKFAYHYCIRSPFNQCKQRGQHIFLPTIRSARLKRRGREIRTERLTEAYGEVTS